MEKKFKMAVTFTFKGTVTVTANDKQQAMELVNKNFGMTAGTGISTSLPHDQLDYEFGMHPDKKIGIPREK